MDSLRLRQMTRVWSTGITNVVLSTIITAHFIILRASVNGRRCRLTSPHGLLPPLRALVWPHFQHNSMPFQYFLERKLLLLSDGKTPHAEYAHVNKCH